MAVIYKGGYRKGTKAWQMERLTAQFAIYEIIDDVIKAGVAKGTIKYGWNLAYGIFEDYSYRWYHGIGEGGKCRYYGNGMKTAKVWDYKYHTDRVREQILKIGEKLIEAGVEMGFNQYAVCKHGVEEKDLPQWVLDNGCIEGMIDEDNPDGTEWAVGSYIENIVDEWSDYCKKHGHN